MTDQIRELAALLTPAPTTPDLYLRPADVVSIAPDGWPRIKIAGGSTIIPGPASANGVVSLKPCIVGDRVWLWENGTDRFIIASTPDPKWITPTLLSTWGTGGGSGPVQYRKDALGFVHMRGWTQAVSSPPNPIFTLPAGYRPGVWMSYPVDGGPAGTNAVKFIQIQTNGDVQAVGLAAGEYISVDPCAFLAEG